MKPDVIALCEYGFVPDRVIRWGARRISQQRLDEHERLGPEQSLAAMEASIAEWAAGPIAIATADANEQHYEVPADFFRRALGPHLKYSCCLWLDGVQNLAEAEEAMLQQYAERACLEDGQKILDLGCGWGSFSLWAAAQYPAAQVTAVSNSVPQKAFIDACAAERGLENLTVITADINDFEPRERFDRIISIEMLEHVRNHQKLFERIAQWLSADGLFFAHVFCHHQLTYAYEDRDQSDWMTRHFFSGGMMPSFDLFSRYDQHLQLQNQWWVNGQHYQKTSDAWLLLADQYQAELKATLGGGRLGAVRLQRWRMFFMAVAEFFGMHAGEQWGVGHYLFKPR